MMRFSDIPHARLANLGLSRAVGRTPVEVVGRLGAMQAQDFAGAKWSLGLRLWPASDAAIEDVFNRGDILRTHVLRPTWHFVTPADARRLLALTAPRVHVTNGSMYRLLELDEETLGRSADAMTRALSGGRQLIRNELKDVLEVAGIPTAGGRDRSGQRLAYILMWAELEGLIISGPRRGKQFTYMLLDERVPATPPMPREEALAELIRRYYQSHGPATAADLARWSSLTLADVRQGLQAAGSALHQEEIEGQTYWFTDPAPPQAQPSPTAYLMSIYDEYTIGYKDRSAIGEAEHGERMQALGNALQNVIILDGQIAGTWRRDVTKSAVTVELNLFRSLSDGERAAVGKAAEQYGEFLGKTSEVF